MRDVLILGEVKDGSLDPRIPELLGAGKRLAEASNGNYNLLLMGDAVSQAADDGLFYGPARVYKLEHPLLQGFQPDMWLEGLEKACREIQPKILLMSHAFVGMEIGPRLSGRLNTRLTTDCIDLAINPDDGLLLRTKPVSGGNAISVFKGRGALQLATVRKKVFPPLEPNAAVGEIVDLSVNLDESMLRVTFLERVKEEVVSTRQSQCGGGGRRRLRRRRWLCAS